MAKYGKTFWGKEWLNALSKVDWDNRLPRGSAYASRGAVRNITINSNHISAKVQGSRPKPYQIDISVPEFSNEQKEKLTDILSSNPAWLAGLLNRQLPAELLEIAKQKDIKIFPSQWSDFKMECSCPDWAVPCKHLAAVVYIIANEIDLNPIKVLELHRFNVTEELKKRNVDVSENISEAIEDLSENLELISFKKAEQITNLYYPDLSTIPDIGENFLQLLSPHPPFHQKDFREILLLHFRFAQRNIHKSFHKEYIEKLNLHTCIDAKIIVDEHLNNAQLLFVYEKEEKKISLYDWLKTAGTIAAADTTGWCFSLRLLYEYCQFCIHLIAKGAVIPQLLKAGKEHFIWWLPLMQNEIIKNILEQFATIIPQNFILISENKKGEGLKVFPKEKIAIHLAALINTNILKNNVRSSYAHKFDQQDFFQQLFFGVRIEKQIDNLSYNDVQLWLKKLHLSQRDLLPIIKIEENFPSFFLSLFVADRSAKEIQAPLPLHQFKKDKRYAKQQMTVLKDLMLLQEHFPDVSKILNNSDEKELEYDSDKFSAVLLEMLPILQLLGMEVLLPKSLKHLIKPQTSLKMKTNSKEKARTWMDLQSLLDFNWQVAIGDILMDEKEFLKLTKGMSGIVKLRDNFIHLTKDDLEKLMKQLQQPPHLSQQEMLRVMFAGEYNGAKISLSEELQELLKQWTSVEKINEPLELKATMRPYQQRGYEWLYKNSRICFGSILADDMGLGKTLQTIALLLKFKEEKMLTKDKALVVVPTSLLTNWSHELEKFAPSLSYFIYHGSKRNIKNFNEQDLLITSYGTARSDMEFLNKITWNVLIVDEAQNIKNHTTDQTKAIKSIKANIKIALSGTPVENRLSEYWSIFDFTNKGFLGSQKFFNDYFATPIQQDRSQQKLDTFRKLTQPFILRRLKIDKTIISDLPDKIENNAFCSLTKQQVALYENVVKQTMEQVENSEGIERKGLVLKMMTALKQICNHPFQYTKTGVCDQTHSGKLQLLFELLQPLVENQEKTLIFTQYKEMGDLLSKFLSEQFQTEPLFLHGSLQRKQRDEMVKSFQQFQHHKIFILSLKAGGTGLNLTAATNVIHYDLWWNPAVETQATDRAYRIGQQKNVMVYRIISKGTLEEKIDAMINSKKELADLTVMTGEKWLGELNNKELKELVKLSDKMEN